MKHVHDSLTETKNELFKAILRSDLNTILQVFSEDITYSNRRHSKSISGIQSLKEKLVLLFEDKEFALAETENRITLAGDKAMDWSSFTLFIDQLSKNESISFEGSCALIWEKRENEKWFITHIIDSTFEEFPL